MPSERQETALVTAIGGFGANSNLLPSWVIYLKKKNEWQFGHNKKKQIIYSWRILLSVVCG